jgi:hypothetical protein
VSARTVSFIASSLLGTTFAAADPPSPTRAAALSATPFFLGAGMAVVGLVVANQRDCTTEPTGTARCTDLFDVGVGITVGGGVLIGVGPSLGHVYAGDVWTTGLKLRLAGIGIAGAGLVALGFAHGGCRQIVCGSEVASLGVVMIGAGTFVTGGALDVARVGDAARARSSMQLSLAPIRTPSSTVLGLAAHGTF